jgi:signal transduction histidine kinase
MKNLGNDKRAAVFDYFRRAENYVIMIPGIFLTLLLILPAVLSAQTQHELDSLEKLLPLRSGREKVKLLNDLTYYHFQSDPGKAVLFGEQSLKLAKTLKDDRLLASTYNDYSMPFLTKGDFEKVVYLNNLALQIRLKINDTTGIISSRSKLGNAYFEMTRYSEAQAQYNEAIRLLKITGDELTLAKIYQNSANILESRGFFREALDMQKDIQEIAKRLQDDGLTLTNLGNMGSCYRKLGNYRKSRECYLEAAKYARSNPEMLSQVYQGLGVTERAAGNNDLGLLYYKKAYDIYRQLGSDVGTGIVAVNIGNTYAEMNRYDSAEVYLHEGLGTVLRTKSYRQIANAYHNLGKLEQRRGNYKAAAEFLGKETLYKDSVMLFEGSEMIGEMFARYEVEKKERELAESKAQIAETRLQKVIWLGVSALLLMLLVLIFLYFRRKRMQARAELERTRQEEELLREKQLSEQKLGISRELHDNIGSQITYMISSMDNLTYIIPEDDDLRGTIRDLSEFGRETMQELRSTIWAMNAEEGSVDVLLRKIEELRSRIPIGLITERKLAGNPVLKAAEMLNLYRIAQEALQNCLKYAGAQSFTIRVFENGSEVTFEFSDDGNGFDLSAKHEGNGLRNMRYRCEQLGGTFSAASSENKGTAVSCVLRHLSY